MLRLLVLEDEPLIAEMLLSWAKEMGCEAVATASNCDALKLIGEVQPDVAILDVCVSDGDCYPVADRLQALSIPFLFATGLSDAAIDPRYAHVRIANKPFEFDVLRSIILELAQQRCTFITSELDRT